MALAKVQVTLTYEYAAEYDAQAATYEENERISAEAQDSLRNLVGSVVSINKDGKALVSDVTITSGGVSVVTVPGQ